MTLLNGHDVQAANFGQSAHRLLAAAGAHKSGRGGVEDNHLTDVENLPPPPRVYMSIHTYVKRVYMSIPTYGASV